MGFNDHPLILKLPFKKFGEMMNTNIYPSTKGPTQELSLFSIHSTVTSSDLSTGHREEKRAVWLDRACHIPALLQRAALFWCLSACICKLVNVISALQGWGEHENVGGGDSFDMLG